MFQPENALPIISWYDNPRDKELQKIGSILEKLAFVEDVRNYIKFIVTDNRILFTRAQNMLNSTVQRIINKEKIETKTSSSNSRGESREMT